MVVFRTRDIEKSVPDFPHVLTLHVSTSSKNHRCDPEKILDRISSIPRTSFFRIFPIPRPGLMLQVSGWGPGRGLGVGRIGSRDEEGFFHLFSRYIIYIGSREGAGWISTFYHSQVDPFRSRDGEGWIRSF